MCPGRGQLLSGRNSRRRPPSLSPALPTASSCWGVIGHHGVPGQGMGLTQWHQMWLSGAPAAAAGQVCCVSLRKGTGTEHLRHRQGT